MCGKVDNPPNRYVDLSERYKDKGKYKVRVELGYKEISGNKEKNKVKLMVFLYRNNVHSKRIFADSVYKMTLIFDESEKANECIDKISRGDVYDAKAFVATVQNKLRKEVISDWDRFMSLKELIEAVDDKEDRLVSVERVMKRVRGERDEWLWSKCDSITLTFSGDSLPDYVQLYGGACSMRVRPYVENVIQ